jgi:hypothetical protein
MEGNMNGDYHKYIKNMRYSSSSEDSSSSDDDR